MATPHFYLRDKNSKEPTLISLYFFKGRKRYAISTGYSVKPSLWSFTKERVKSAAPDSEVINLVLDDLAINVQVLYEKILKEKGQVSRADLKEGMDIKRGKIRVGQSLFEFIENLIRIRRDSPEYKDGSIEVYNTAFKHLKLFAKKKRREFDFSDIDYKFFSSFTTYLVKEGYTNNHINKILSNLKSFLNEATREGVNKNLKYKDVRIKVQKETADAIYLNDSELRKLYKFDFSDKPHLERVRNAFILASYTGLRYSDWTRITPENLRTIDGADVIDIVTQKTGKRVYIPLHPFVKEILDKYGHNLPDIAISNQKTNKYLKEMAKLAGFTEQIGKSQTIGGEKVTKFYPRYKLISTHTARRSFCSNAYKAGIPAPAIMKISGHKTESSFMAYIKIKDQENAVILSRNAFFNASPLKVAKNG